MCRRVLALTLLFSLPTLNFADEPGEGYLPEPLELLDKIPVADSAFLRHRGLPASVDLSRDFPPPGNQGKQGSCVGFATTYAIKTYYERRKRKWDVSRYEHIFSPAWTYNQINKGRDRGAHIPHALELLVQKGAVPWSVMPYDANDYRTQPNEQQKQMALQFKARNYEQVPVDNVDALKAELARGNPLAIGVYTGPDRRNCCRNNEVFDHFTQKRYMGHAMVLVGYDDRKVSPRGHRGAFKLMDSGGTQVATGGFGWVSYEFAPQLLYAAYVLRDGDATLHEQPTEPELLPPAHVYASQGSHNDKIVLSWQNAAGATAYEIERSIAGDFQFLPIGYSATTSFEDTAVQEDVAYDYRVVSIRDQKKSDREKSAIIKGYAATQTKADSPPPVLPPVIAARPGRVENLSASAGTFAGKILLTWDSVPGASRYWVVRYDRSASEWKEIAWVTTNRYEDSSPEVLSGISQAYSVRAANATEAGDAAAPVWGNANPGANRATAIPDTPTDVKASLRNNSVVLAWKGVAKADEYYVFRRRFDAPTWTHAATVKQPRYSENFPGHAGELWYYTVRAKFSSGGESAESAIAAVTMNAQRPVVRARYATDSELAAFAGKWAGDIAAEDRIQTIQLEITSSGENFSVAVSSGPRSRKLSGKYVARSQELGLRGLSIRRVPGNDRLLSLTCRDRALCGALLRGTVQRAE